MNDDERALEMLKLISNAEHHFNNLGFNIRALASTWLLATLGGVGWILKDLPVDPIETGLVINKIELLILLCIVSAVGIFVLWIMDIMVYQRLLNVWFDARRFFEDGEKFPPIRLQMKRLFESGRATELIMLYYLALASAPLCLGLYIALSAGSIFETGFVFILLCLNIGIIFKYSPRDLKPLKPEADAEAEERTSPGSEFFFNLDDSARGVSRQLAEGMKTCVFSGDSAMISVVRIDAGKSGELHSHPQEQWGLCVRGSGVRIQAGERIPVGEGDFWRTPGGVEHGFSAGAEGAVIYDVFAPPRDEYKKSGSGFS